MVYFAFFHIFFIFLAASNKSGGEGTSLGRTIYVVIAIVAVILLGCITVIVYWKVQNSKESVDNSPQNSATPFAKCSSTQLTDVKENTSVQSFVLNEV
jgi:flagellar basal body-associated protein FliL